RAACCARPVGLEHVNEMSQFLAFAVGKSAQAIARLLGPSPRWLRLIEIDHARRALGDLHPPALRFAECCQLLIEPSERGLIPAKGLEVRESAAFVIGRQP